MRWLLLLMFTAACSAPPATNGIVVRGVPITVVATLGEGSRASNANTIYMSVAQEYSHYSWAELYTHEVCHVLDQYFGRPSNAFPSGDGYGGRPSERWADTCSFMWMEREPDLYFVTPFPRLGLDPRNAPIIGKISISDYGRMCSAQPWRSTC